MATMSYMTIVLLFCVTANVGGRAVDLDLPYMCSFRAPIEELLKEMIRLSDIAINNYGDAVADEGARHLYRSIRHPELPLTGIEPHMQVRTLLDTLGDTLVGYRMGLLNLVRLERQHPSFKSSLRLLGINRMMRRIESLLRFVMDINGKVYESSHQTERRQQQLIHFARREGINIQGEQTEVYRVGYQTMNQLRSDILRPTRRALKSITRTICRNS